VIHAFHPAEYKPQKADSAPEMSDAGASELIEVTRFLSRAPPAHLGTPGFRAKLSHGRANPVRPLLCRFNARSR